MDSRTDSNNKKLLKRIESDNLILDAAIKVFGNKGYSGTSLTDIAKEAGVTQGLISQRFSGKLSILVAIFGRIPLSTITSGREDFEEALNFIIEKILQSSKEDEVWFNFLRTVYTGSDVPDEFFAAMRRRFYKTAFYENMQAAQSAGLIRQGDVYDYFLIFYQNAINLIATSKRLNLPVPDKRVFFDVVTFDTEKLRQQERIHRLDTYIDVMTSNFDILCRVDKELRAYEVIKKREEHPIFGSMEKGKEFKEYFGQIIDKYVYEPDKDMVSNRISVDFIEKALEQEELLYIMFRMEIDGRPQYHQLRISVFECEEDGKYFMFGLFNVDRSIRVAMAMEEKA